jgi:hypothetical protein
MTASNYPLTQEEFREWLLSKSKDEIVGWQGWCKGCPIFKCLKDKNLDISMITYEFTHFLDNRINSLENPDWVKSFINAVDGRPICLIQDEIDSSITASQALEVLSQIV